MAFSTQKDFFRIPFMNEHIEYGCNKDCTKLKSYESTIDDRSWADEVKQSRFLTELVQCQTPLATDDSGYDSTLVAGGRIRGAGAGGRTGAAGGRAGAAGGRAGGVGGVSADAGDRAEGAGAGAAGRSGVKGGLGAVSGTGVGKDPSAGAGTDDTSLDGFEPESSTDVKYLQNRVNSLRKELGALRKQMDDKGGVTCRRDSETIESLIKERDSLREKLASYKELEKKVVDMKKRTEKAEHMSTDLTDNIESQSNYILEMENEMQSMQKYYEEEMQKLKYNETFLKCKIDEFKDEILRMTCKAQRAETLEHEIAVLRNEILRRDVILSDYDCQFKQLMLVIEELRGNAIANLADSGTQKCQDYYEDLAFFMSATLNEIMKELSRRCGGPAGIGGFGGFGKIDGVLVGGDGAGEFREERQVLAQQIQMKELECEKLCADTLNKLHLVQDAYNKLRKEYGLQEERFSKTLQEKAMKLEDFSKRMSQLDQEMTSTAAYTREMGKGLTESMTLMEKIGEKQRENEIVADRLGQMKMDVLQKELDKETALRRASEIERDNLREELKRRDVAKAAGPGAAESGRPSPSQAEKAATQQGGPGAAQAGGPGAAQAGGSEAAKAGGPGAAQAGGPGAAQAGGPGAGQAGRPGAAQAGGSEAAKAGGPGAAQSAGPGAGQAGRPGVAQAGGPSQAQAGGPGAPQAGGRGAAQAGGPGGAQPGGPGAAQPGGPGAAQAGGPGAAQAGRPGASQAGGPGAAQTGGLGAAQAGGPGAAQAGGPGAAQGGGPGAAKAGGPGAAQAGGPGAAEAVGPGVDQAGGPSATKAGPGASGGPGAGQAGGPGAAGPRAADREARGPDATGGAGAVGSAGRRPDSVGRGAAGRGAGGPGTGLQFSQVGAVSEEKGGRGDGTVRGAAGSPKGGAAGKRSKSDGLGDHRPTGEGEAYAQFVAENANSLMNKISLGSNLEKELRKILDAFLEECDFCFCKLNEPRNKFYAICHKILHETIQSVTFKELIYFLRKIYLAVEKVRPGYAFKLIMNEQFGPNAEEPCINCLSPMCCSRTEDALKEKVQKLEKDINMAKRYLENMKTTSPLTQRRVKNYEEEDETQRDKNLTYRQSKPAAINYSSQQIKKLKARLLNCSAMLH